METVAHVPKHPTSENPAPQIMVLLQLFRGQHMVNTWSASQIWTFNTWSLVHRCSPSGLPRPWTLPETPVPGRTGRCCPPRGLGGEPRGAERENDPGFGGSGPDLL